MSDHTYVQLMDDNELTELARIAGAVANDPDGKATISAMNYKKAPKTVEFSMVFDTADASQALESIDAQFTEISQVTDFDHENKLLTFFQSNRKDSDKSAWLAKNLFTSSDMASAVTLRSLPGKNLTSPTELSV